MPTTSDGKDQHADRVIVIDWNGSAWLPNVPGRDLDAGDIARLVEHEKEARELIPRAYDDSGKEIEKSITARTVTAVLIASGVYSAPEQPKPEEKPAKATTAKPDVPALKE